MIFCLFLFHLDYDPPRYSSGFSYHYLHEISATESGVEGGCVGGFLAPTKKQKNRNKKKMFVIENVQYRKRQFYSQQIVFLSPPPGLGVHAAPGAASHDSGLLLRTFRSHDFLEARTASTKGFVLVLSILLGIIS